jgi:hypothetical protein
MRSPKGVPSGFRRSNHSFFISTMPPMVRHLVEFYHIGTNQAAAGMAERPA